MRFTIGMLLLGLTLFPLAWACDDDDDDDEIGGDTDTDSDTDTDTDSDADTDTDSDVIDTDTELYEIVWISIPAGDFQMGCSPGDTLCHPVENPAHTVSVPAFEATETEITQHQYETVIGAQPSKFKGCPNCPVDSVNWTQSRAFCEAIGARLLSESEWEYAARAGTTTKYYCGDDPTCLNAIAWYADNAGGRTRPVGRKDPNAFGLYDTLGGVWEWLEDCFHETYDGAPADGSAWVTEDCEYRIVRGGLYGLSAGGLRVSNREGDHPHSYLVATPGFRCARDLAAEGDR